MTNFALTTWYRMMKPVQASVDAKRTFDVIGLGCLTHIGGGP